MSLSRNRPLCFRCRLRTKNDYYGTCLQCAAKCSRVTTTNVKALTQQANAITRPLRASKRLGFGEIEDELLVFCRGETRFLRFNGLSFRIEFLESFNIEDLNELTIQHVGDHGLKTLLHSDRRCLRYTGSSMTTPILERVVVACPGEDGSINFMCTSQDRGVTPFRLPGASALPEVYEARLLLAKNKEYLKLCRTCQQTKPCFEFRWKQSVKTGGTCNYERRCRACVTARRCVYKTEEEDSTASPSTSETSE